MMIGMSGDLSPQVCTLQCSETILDKWSNCVLEARVRPTWGSVAQGGSSSQGMVLINNSFPFISLIQLHMNQPICYENRVQWIRSPHFCKNSLDHRDSQSSDLQWFERWWFNPITKQIPGQNHAITECSNFSRKTCSFQVVLLWVV